MFNLFKKKKDAEEIEPQGESADGGEAPEKPKKKEVAPTQVSSSASADVIKLSTELDRVKASVESFGEVRKGLTERITGLNEQIGELRAMILDRDRTIQAIELKAVKAADLVESVHPDKLMIELQKEDAKFEALKANLEGNEAIMNRMMEEIKEMRKKLEFFRGVEEIVKLSEEIKKELIDIKKVEASIHIDTDKVQTVYAEIRKKFQEIDLFSDNLKEIKIMLNQDTKDIETLKTKVFGLVTKDELDKLVQKVNRYIEALKEVDKKSSLTKDVTRLKGLLESLK
jgi:chromosome segregation ATPase